MEKSFENSQTPSPREEEKLKNEIDELLLSLPIEKNRIGLCLYQYQGFWCPSRRIHGLISFQRLFQALDSDIILTSFPKSGTTWLKSLTFTIVNRSRYALKDSPLLTASPHDFSPVDKFASPTLEGNHLAPRIVSTHTPYASLPESILNCNCRIVYICRNPLDQFVSYWHFIHELQSEATGQIPVEEEFDQVCNGVQAYGPIWEHMLGYWKASVEQPHKILFLKYEDLQEDINFYVEKLADFLGYPFSKEEESQGAIEQVAKFCSFEHLKNLEVNKTGTLANAPLKNKVFFRKGKVGDHTNYLTPQMTQSLEKILDEKLGASGLTFKKS